jgi:hypothetical protein
VDICLSHLNRRLSLTVSLVVMLSTFLSACRWSDDPLLGQVTGRVTLDGEPLRNALVQFQPTYGRSSFGETDDNGNYTLLYMPAKPGAILGSHTVRVTTSQEVPVKQDVKLDEGGSSRSVAPVVQLTKERLHPRYNVNSILHKTVESGHNTIDLELKSGP